MGQRLKLWCVTAEKGLKKFSKNTTFYHGIAQRYTLYEGRLINSRNSSLINSFRHQITRKLVYK